MIIPVAFLRFQRRGAVDRSGWTDVGARDTN